MANGMLGTLGIFGPDPDELEAHRRGAMTPQRQNAERIARGEMQVQRGVQDTVRAATGSPALPDRSAAEAALRQLAKEVRPGTPEFYERAAKILGDAGFVDQAEAMSNKLRAVEFGPEKSGFLSDLEKLQKGRDRAAAVGNQAAVAEFNRRIELLLTPKKTGSGTDPEVVKLIQQLAVETNPEARKVLEARIAKLTHIGDGSDKGALTAYQRERLRLDQERADREKAEKEAKQKEREAKRAAQERADLEDARTAYEAARVQMEAELQTARRLYDHEDLDSLVGPWVGALPDKAAIALTRSDAGALIQQLEGQTFISALQALKRESPKTGASGLGQLTEREGDRILRARAALTRQQKPVKYRENLMIYIDRLLKEGEVVKNAWVRAMETKEREIAGKAVGTSGKTDPASPAKPIAGDVVPAKPGQRGPYAGGPSWQESPEVQKQRDERALRLKEQELRGDPTVADAPADPESLRDEIRRDQTRLGGTPEENEYEDVQPKGQGWYFKRKRGK